MRRFEKHQEFVKQPETKAGDVSPTTVISHHRGLLTLSDRCCQQSICIKSPASGVLVENSVVREGNGLVVGTAGNNRSMVADIHDVTFRNVKR